MSKLSGLTIEELENEYNQALLFDKLSLDDEAVQQAQLYAGYIREYARSKKQAVLAARTLKKVEGQTTVHIRRNYKEYGFNTKDELKEKAIEAFVLGDEEVEVAYYEWLDADERARVLKRILDALEQRKTMMRLAGDLYIREYYLDDSIKVETTQETQEFRKHYGERRRRTTNS